MSPCGMGAILVTLLISPKFWHIHHFRVSGSGSTIHSSPSACLGASNGLGRFAALHSSLMCRHSSSIVRPIPSWALCASVIGARHLTSLGEQGSTAPASISSLIFLCMYAHFGEAEHSSRWPQPSRQKHATRGRGQQRVDSERRLRIQYGLRE